MALCIIFVCPQEHRDPCTSFEKKKKKRKEKYHLVSVWNLCILSEQGQPRWPNSKLAKTSIVFRGASRSTVLPKSVAAVSGLTGFNVNAVLLLPKDVPEEALHNLDYLEMIRSR